MAIAASYVLNGISVPTASGALYTVPASTVQSYVRDLVLTNAGTTTIYIALNTAGSPVATTTGSFVIPTGGSLILTQCGVTNAATVYGLSPTNAGAISIGYATNVAYV